jgi:UPF0755 protein
VGRRLVLVFTALLLFVGLPLLVAPWFGWFTRPLAPVAVTIPKGASLPTAAAKLDAADIISSAGQFRLLARLFGRNAPIQAGPYKLRPGAPWRDILQQLQRGDISRSQVTIPEGMPSVMVAERLRADTRLTGPVMTPEEGSVLPETYDITEGEPRAAVLARMQAAMKETLAALWAKRSPQTVVKTPEEAIILASIVEKETGKPEERRKVAGVYSNRLRQGVKLDADPTVIYPITQGRPLGRRIRQSELARDTGYNTYLKPGLPKGPITNPGKASIAAVLDPEATEALFFVADGQGGHVFASTLAEQNANVAKWYAIRRQRGEM